MCVDCVLFCRCLGLLWKTEIQESQSVLCLSQLSARPLSNLMLQTPQLSSAAIWDLSQGPGSALIFYSAISLCQWSYWNSRVHESVFWHQESLCSQRRMVCFYWLAELHWCCWEWGAVGGSGHWAIQWIPTVAQINLWLMSTQLWVQEDFSSFPTGTQRTACRKWRNVLLDVSTDRKSLQLIFVSSPGWKSK